MIPVLSKILSLLLHGRVFLCHVTHTAFPNLRNMLFLPLHFPENVRGSSTLRAIVSSTPIDKILFVGYAVFSQEFTSIKQLPLFASILIVELCGVHTAIECIQNTNTDKFIIFVDSQSALAAMASTYATENAFGAEDSYGGPLP